jgi:hypothetical protein
LRKHLLQSLRPKDLRDTSAAVLEDHLQGAAHFVEKFPEHGGPVALSQLHGCNLDIPEDIFRSYLLCPHIAYEKITAWRGFLKCNIPKKWQEIYEKQGAAGLYRELSGEIQTVEERLFTKLYWPPEIAFARRQCDKRSKSVLLVALLRTLGTPARLNPADGMPETWNGRDFTPVMPREAGTVHFRVSASNPFVYGQNWSLSKYTENNATLTSVNCDVGWLPMNTPSANGNTPLDNILSAELPAGLYRLITSTRLPNGNQFATRSIFRLQPSEHLELDLSLRKYDIADMLFSRRLPIISTDVESNNLVIDRCSLLLWLEDGAEPTEHLLNEMLEIGDDLWALPIEVYFFLKSREALEHPALKMLLSKHRNMHVQTEDWAENLESLARFTFCDPDTPPLMIACDREGNAVYATSGYNVGAVPLLARIIERL